MPPERAGAVSRSACVTPGGSYPILAIAGFPLPGVVSETPPSITSQSRGSDETQADGSARGAPGPPDPADRLISFGGRPLSCPGSAPRSRALPRAGQLCIQRAASGNEALPSATPAWILVKMSVPPSAASRRMDVQGLGDGFGAQVVGHAFPDHQRSRAAVKPGCVKLIV